MTTTRWARTRPVIAGAVFALIASLLTVAPIAAHAADSTGSISGVVTRADARQADHIYARAFRLDDADPTKRSQKGSALVGPAGAFRIDALPTGRYIVDFYAYDDGVIDEYWADAPTVESARIIGVNGTDITGIVAELAVQGLVSGTVTRPGGSPVSGVEVTLYKRSDDTWDRWSTAITDEHGAYALYGGTGTFSLGFGDLVGEFLGEWWPDQQDQANAAGFDLAIGDQVIADAELSEGASIAGRVTTSDGTSRAGLKASVYRWEHLVGSRYRWEHVRSVDVDENGEYRIGGLHPGTYTMHFSGAPNVTAEWWNDTLKEDEAERFDLNIGDHQSGVDAQLTVLGTVTGTFTREDGVPIWAEAQFYRQVPTDGGITWVLEGSTDAVYAQYAMHLRAGTYTVKFAPVGPSSTVRAEWWNDSREQAGAESFEVRLGETISGISPIMNFLDPFPAATEVPEIAGVPVVGSTLTADPGVWPMQPYLYFQWLADGVAIAGATAESLTVPPAVVGKRITIAVAGSRPGYSRTTVISEATQPVQPAQLASTIPVLLGTPKVGQDLAVDYGDWTEGTDVTVRWFADGVSLNRDEGWLHLGKEHAGKRITATLTGTKPGYQTISRTSAPSAVVTGGVLTAPTPSISGLVAVGSTLTAKPGTWTAGATLSYQWLANGVSIAGGTKPTFTPSSAHSGKVITVKVTGKKLGFTSVTRASTATLKVANAATPRIGGAPRVGSVLTALPGTWTAGTTFTYRWHANGVAISYASGSKLKLTNWLRGKVITVKVTGHKPGYATVTRTSAATSKVP